MSKKEKEVKENKKYKGKNKNIAKNTKPLMKEH